MAQQEEIQLWQTVEPVEFTPRIDDAMEAQSLLISTRQGPGYAIAGGQLGHAIFSRATHVLMDFSQQACALRYQVDGNWEQLPPLDRETGDAMLYALKQLCQLNPADRRSAQTGKLGLKVAKEKYGLTLQSQGVQTGERVLARIEAEKVPFEKMPDLGMRDKMVATLKDKLNEGGNIVLVTAPKGDGLTTTWITAMNAADRFIRDFQSLERQDLPEPEIINVNPNFFGGDTELTQFELAKKILLKEPDVLMFPELPDNEAFELALEHVGKHQKQIYIRCVADSAIEGLAQVISQYPSLAKEIVKHMGAILSQRLVRRLCDNCKLGYEPTPQMLKQLGIPAGRVGLLYQPFIPPPPEQQVDENGRPAPITPCHICGGRGYFGRIAVFDLLTPGDQLKAALLKTRDINQLTQVARSEGQRGIQAEAILAVVRGLTSLDELKRVFAKK
jgi:type II secretory ATPase GspE/PulE/Tfp pilus assembly ATPase PilB-like protein